MTIQALIGFLVYSLINAFTPGPGNLLALSATITHGLKGAKSLLWGIFFGYYVVQILCAIIVFGLDKYVHPAMSIMKYLGAAYILWLAFHIFRSNPGKTVDGKRSSFITGFLLQFINVKIYLFGITALTGYVTPYYGSFSILLLSELIIATIGSIATLSWAIAGNAFQNIYLRYFSWINLVLALLLVQCAIGLLLIE